MLFSLLPIVCLCVPLRGLVITISLSEEFLIHSEIHTEFDSKTIDTSIRILPSKSNHLFLVIQLMPITLLRLSRSNVSRQTPFILPIRSRFPTKRKSQFS
jgi:hypothetical protein